MDKVKLKQVFKESLAFLYFILVMVLFLFGCSTAPVIIERPVIIEVPALRDSVVLRDSVIYKDSIAVDSLWYGEVKDSLGKIIGDLKVYYKTKIAELKLNAGKDTVFIKDTVSTPNSILPVIVNSFNWWEAGLWFGGMGLLTGLIAYLRLKRGKIF